ncbi:DUF2061 domain-containing protein [Pseudorhodobacter sp.]|uniref:DUF2061 domain-containing protein n=1 Tax=Pseudorhodobacter sp. TaxID=1934400 RepID=UPI0026472577|nr:DUF2061 domain-containing protein [Pseudorhodobacter sp.]MDN5788223.1 DUF2061 domain-containing protein [Pseudorhodobacter sp.]
MESRRRSLVKAVVWQMIGLISMGVIGWLYTGSAAVAGGLALVNMAAGFVVYLLHERVWATIAWGKMEGQDASRAR